MAEGWATEYKLITAQHMKAYVNGGKNDLIDAEAICDAASRPRTCSVTVKTLEQILSTEHKLGKSWGDDRVGIIYQVHFFCGSSSASSPLGRLLRGLR